MHPRLLHRPNRLSLPRPDSLVVCALYRYNRNSCLWWATTRSFVYSTFRDCDRCPRADLDAQWTSAFIFTIEPASRKKVVQPPLPFLPNPGTSVARVKDDQSDQSTVSKTPKPRSETPRLCSSVLGFISTGSVPKVCLSILTLYFVASCRPMEQTRIESLLCF